MTKTSQASLCPGPMILFLCGACLMGGCLHIDTPGGFVELEDRSLYAYRATSATGVVLAVRNESSRKKQGGDLGFWSEAVTRKMQRLGGYALLEQRDMKTRKGLAGKQLRFGHDRDGRPQHYWITLFIDGTDLLVVEAGGPKDAFTAVEGSLQEAIASLEPPLL